MTDEPELILPPHLTVLWGEDEHGRPVYKTLGELARMCARLHRAARRRRRERAERQREADAEA